MFPHEKNKTPMQKTKSCGYTVTKYKPNGSDRKGTLPDDRLSGGHTFRMRDDGRKNGRSLRPGVADLIKAFINFNIDLTI